MSWMRRSLVAALVTVTTLAPLAAAEGVPSQQAAPAAQERPHPTVHSSDGIRGAALTGSTQGRRFAAGDLDEVDWQVAPGLTYSQWTQFEQQGPIRVSLLTARLDQPGLVLDQISGATVAARAPLSRWVREDRAIAGINADFFDINDTGAPLGVGADRQRQTLHAPRKGWNTSFLIDTRGTARVTQDQLVAKLVRPGRTAIGISNFNSPTVTPGGIGLYTSAWGRTLGKRVVDGARRVRQVVVRGGKVRSNRATLSSGTTITGDLLVGRDDATSALRRLRVGQRVRVVRSLSVPARVAVSGSVQLLRNGAYTTSDNRELHPRTAVGIDRDERLLHLVVVDGRSETSRGQTLLQLATLLRSLGDEDALNLDGGGSSTMIAKDPLGTLAVRNQPSDGQERPVPNGLGFRYTPPGG